MTRTPTQPAAPVPEQIASLVAVLNLLRSGEPTTRPDLMRASSLGRALVDQRVADAIGYGLVVDADLGPSTGGRAPRQVRFRADRGIVLVAELGATGMAVGVSDLAGNLQEVQEEVIDIADGPDVVLQQVQEAFDALLRRGKATSRRPDPAVWGVGIGVPGPVEFATGTPTAPPIMPGWDGYPLRERLAQRYRAPVWADNEVNLMALGELRAGRARDISDMIFVKIGTGIGAGLVGGGQLHRGAKGCAGDVGHVAVVDDESIVCRCGNVGCLEALAGGAALARDGLEAAREGRSPFLAHVLAEAGTIVAADLSNGAAHGDPVCVNLLARSARLVGEMLAGLVNFYNPELIVIGGGVADSGEKYLSGLRQVIYSRSLPLATRDLQITRSLASDRAGLRGAAFMVVDELFSAKRIGRWIQAGTPSGRPAVAVG